MTINKAQTILKYAIEYIVMEVGSSTITDTGRVEKALVDKRIMATMQPCGSKRTMELKSAFESYKSSAFFDVFTTSKLKLDDLLNRRDEQFKIIVDAEWNEWGYNHYVAISLRKPEAV